MYALASLDYCKALINIDIKYTQEMNELLETNNYEIMQYVCRDESQR